MSLSEKRKELWNKYGHGEITSHVYQIILLQDKEAVRLLKESFKPRNKYNYIEIENEIDKIFGPKLI